MKSLLLIFVNAAYSKLRAEMLILRSTLLAIALLLHPQGWDSSTVAVKAEPDKPAVLMRREEAEAKFQELCANPTDVRLHAALAIALDKFPDWPAFVMKDNRSVCSKQ